MSGHAFHTAIGLMSGTSLDGIDVVKVLTDGDRVCEVEGAYGHPFPQELRERLAHVAQGGDISLDDLLRLERALSEEYAMAVRQSGLLDATVNVVGCHGQTIRHLPKEGLTWQLGDPNVLAERLGMPVAMDFRRRDMAAGGEGAPLAPLFHAAMVEGKVQGPWAVLNIGGVANVTYGDGKGGLFASDCGPGGGLLDSWVKEKTGAAFDEDGRLALRGNLNGERVLKLVAENPFWQRPVPRSADRYEFYGALDAIKDLSVEDGAATLAALTVAGVDVTLHELGARPEELGALLVSGGGVKNPALLSGLSALGWAVKDLTATTGWHPQQVEAACFAWLAVRRLQGLSTTLPTTTRCSRPTCGGVLTA